MAAWHLAQLNVGTARFPMDDVRIRGFVSRLDEINALADRAPGFVWRLQSDSGNATDIQLTDDPRFIVNLSVWQSIEALFDFAYRSEHAQVMALRRHWFEPHDGAYQVLWWIPAGNRPAPQEALERLKRLRELGPTAEAFSFKTRFPPPDA